MQDILIARILGWVIGGGCFLAGVGFLFFAKVMKRINEIMNKAFYPLENLEKLFRKEIHSEQWIVSNSKTLGVTSLLISIVFFVVLLMG